MDDSHRAGNRDRRGSGQGRGEAALNICLQTGRDKDHERVRIFRGQAELDLGYLSAVLKRHELEAKWEQWTT